MPRTQVERLLTVDAYECDGPTCREVCLSYSGVDCSWPWIFDPSEPHRPGEECWPCWQERARRYFCSWACLASWANAMGQALPLVTQEAVPLPQLPY